jgi:hypothetical protein
MAFSYFYIKNKAYIEQTWYLYFMLLVLLIITNITWKYKNIEKQEFATKVKRIYFVVTLFIALCAVPSIGLESIKSIGENKLGIPNIFYFILWIIVCLALVYMVFMSSINLSEISFGGTKITLLKEQIKEGMEAEKDNYLQTSDMIMAEHTLLQKHLDNYIKFIEKKIVRGERNFYFYLQHLLDKYFSLREKIEISAKIYEFNSSLKEECLLKEREFRTLNNLFNDDKIWFAHNIYYYMFIPYFSSLYGQKKIIVLKSNSGLMKEEGQVVLNILKILENNVAAILYDIYIHQ